MAILQSGRDVPVPDMEDIIAPASYKTPLRVGTHSQQSTLATLHALQQFKRDIISFSHVGLNVIKEISPEFKSLLQGVLFVNIISWFKPNEFGREFGIVIVESFYYRSQPFEICCEPSNDGTLLVRVESDDDIIPVDKATALMCQFQCALEQLMGAHLVEGEPQKLGDVVVEDAGEKHRI
jgi:hypothetical protein